MLDFISQIESSVRGYVRSFPTVFATASGSWLTDHAGRRYLDFFSGAGALNYGHNHPAVKQALLDYIQRDGVQHSLDMATEAKVKFLQAFQEVILKPRSLDYRIQFTGPTGTNAVEAAIKLAKKAKQRSHIVAFTNAYHGHTLGSLTLTGNRYYHDEHFGSHQNVSHLPFDGYLGDFDTTILLEKMLKDGCSGLPIPAAVIVETIQGEGGIRVASQRWLQNLSRICEEHDILLIIDDIQVGNGRTGTFFSFEPAGIRPAMVCLSKSIGGGLPMSLLLMRPELDVWKPGQHTGTFRGNNLAFVAATSLLEHWRAADFASQIQAHGEFVRQRLLKIATRYALDASQVRGRGLIWGLELPSGELATRATKHAFELGLVIETSGADDQVIKLLPALNMSMADLQLGLERLEQSLELAVSPAPSSVTFPSLESIPMVHGPNVFN
jgi:diaminobutyrate-2-oxoglutarate transaminase